MLQSDWTKRRLVVPSRPLIPLYEIEGFSTFPAISENGARVAFLNTKTGGQYRYNLAVVGFDGVLQKYVEATTSGFSRPAFVGTTVLANEIFKDRYETTLVDLSDNSIRREAVFGDTASALAVLEHLDINVME